MKRRGFTLLEMLVVFALILIAAAILFPVFARLNEPNHPHGSCRRNLKQITFGFKQYVQDYDEHYPLVALSETTGGVLSKVPLYGWRTPPYGWADALDPYLKTTQVLRCPSARYSAQQELSPTHRGYTDYWYNRNIAGRNEKKLSNSAVIIIMGDGNDGRDNTTARYNIAGLPASWRSDRSSPAYRHLDGAEYAFVDGHVKWLKPEKVTTAPVSSGSYTFAIQ